MRNHNMNTASTVQRKSSLPLIQNIVGNVDPFPLANSSCTALRFAELAFWWKWQSSPDKPNHGPYWDPQKPPQKSQSEFRKRRPEYRPQNTAVLITRNREPPHFRILPDVLGVFGVSKLEKPHQMPEVAGGAEATAASPPRAGCLATSDALVIILGRSGGLSEWVHRGDN